MKTALVLIALLGAALNLPAVTVTLVGNNSNPGFVTLDVGGTDYQALDYTGQRYATQGQTWTANEVTYDTGSIDLQNDGYYGPNDPLIKDSNYVTLYDEEMYLFTDLEAPSLTSTQIANIQAAVYSIFDSSYSCGSTGTNSCHSYVTAAETSGTTPPSNVNSFLFIDSPLTSTPLVQGFIILTSTGTPEPATMALMGMGLLGLGVLRRVKRAK